MRLEALHMSGVDDMSTQDIFGYFKEYPPAHIEWIEDTSCKYTASLILPHCHNYTLNAYISELETGKVCLKLDCGAHSQIHTVPRQRGVARRHYFNQSSH